MLLDPHPSVKSVLKKHAAIELVAHTAEWHTRGHTLVNRKEGTEAQARRTLKSRPNTCKATRPGRTIDKRRTPEAPQGSAPTTGTASSVVAEPHGRQSTTDTQGQSPGKRITEPQGSQGLYRGSTSQAMGGLEVVSGPGSDAKADKPRIKR